MNVLLKYLNTIASFLASAGIIYFFVQALLFPEANINWIYSSAVIIFVVEFFSIHSSAAMFGEILSKNKKRNATYLFIFYLIFTIALTVVFKNYILPFFFILSTYIKLFTFKHISISKTYFFIAIPAFIIPLLIVSAGAPLLQNLFPFPPEVTLARPENIKGLFYDVPQTVLVWGVLYFSIQFLINIFFLIKNWALKRS